MAGHSLWPKPNVHLAGVSNRGFCFSSAINRETRNFNFKFKASNFRFPPQGDAKISRFSARIPPALQLPHFPTWPTPISPKMDLCYAQTTIRLPLRFEATLWVRFPCQNSRMIFHFPLPNFPDILLILRYFVAFSADRKHFILISCQASWEKRTNFCW